MFGLIITGSRLAPKVFSTFSGFRPSKKGNFSKFEEPHETLTWFPVSHASVPLLTMNFILILSVAVDPWGDSAVDP